MSSTEEEKKADAAVRRVAGILKGVKRRVDPLASSTEVFNKSVISLVVIIMRYLDIAEKIFDAQEARGKERKNKKTTKRRRR